MKTCKISHKRQGGAEFFYAALWVLWFSHGVYGLPCPVTAAPHPPA